MKKWHHLSFTSLSAIMMVFVVAISSFSFRHLSGGNVLAQTSGTLQQTLTQIALQDLQAEYDSQVSGNAPSRQLATQFNGTTGHEVSSSQRASTAQSSNQTLATYGFHYTSVNVNLAPLGTRDDGAHVFLDATESTTFYFPSKGGDPSAPTQTDQVVPHTFVFSQTKDGYLLIYDSTGCDPYGYHPCAPLDASTEPLAPQDENGTAIDPGPLPTPASITPNPPTMPSERPLFACNYNGTNAASYAYYWAYGRNPAFRSFGNDCTNFASQALSTAGGGWLFRHCCNKYKDWNKWWYDLYDFSSGAQKTGQTRTWTQAQALEYFVPNSGRGHYTVNPYDLQLGDIIFVDWEGDNVIDHTMVVTFAGGTWASTLLTYHTTDTRNRSVVSIQAQVPSARFYPYWICANQ